MSICDPWYRLRDIIERMNAWDVYTVTSSVKSMPEAQSAVRAPFHRILYLDVKQHSPFLVFHQDLTKTSLHIGSTYSESQSLKLNIRLCPRLSKLVLLYTPESFLAFSNSNMGELRRKKLVEVLVVNGLAGPRWVSLGIAGHRWASLGHVSLCVSGGREKVGHNRKSRGFIRISSSTRGLAVAR